MALFTPYGNRWCTVIHMGSLNADPTFIVIMMKLQIEWYMLSNKCGLKK